MFDLVSLFEVDELELKLRSCFYKVTKIGNPSALQWHYSDLSFHCYHLVLHLIPIEIE